MSGWLFGCLCLSVRERQRRLIFHREVEEDKLADCVDMDGFETVVTGTEIFNASYLRSLSQSPVRAVAPAMIGTNELVASLLAQP